MAAYPQSSVCSRRRPVDEKADLRDAWKGEFVTPYGYFTMDLKVEGSTKGYCMDLSDNMIIVQDFKARVGLVTDKFRFRSLSGYVVWLAEWFDVPFNLSAVEDELEGYMTPKSGIGGSTVPLKLSKINNN